MNLPRNERLLDKVAAEYVLGTLKGGARRRFESWLRIDPQVRRATAEWQDRLHPMAELAPAVAPPPAVWQAISKRLGLVTPATAGTTRAVTPPNDRWAFWQGLRDDLSFWRGLGMASTAVATILVAVLASRQPEPAAPLAPVASYVAMLADDKAQPVAIVTGDEGRHQLTVKVVLPQSVAADKSLQLWAVPKSGAPRPLGLVAGNGSITLPLPAGTTPQSVGLLAISLEPRGGSPDPKGPTGPIIFKGAWVGL